MGHSSRLAAVIFAFLMAASVGSAASANTERPAEADAEPGKPTPLDELPTAQELLASRPAEAVRIEQMILAGGVYLSDSELEAVAEMRSVRSYPRMSMDELRTLSEQPDAKHELRTFGVLLTDEELEKAEAAQAMELRRQDVADLAQTDENFAHASIQEDESLVLYFDKEPEARLIESAIELLQPERLSWQLTSVSGDEQSSIVDQLEATLRSGRPAEATTDVPAPLLESLSKLADQAAELYTVTDVVKSKVDVTIAGPDFQETALIGEFLSESGVQFTLSTEPVLGSDIAVDTGVDAMCDGSGDSHWCGSPRAGTRIEMAGPFGLCTIGPSINLTESGQFRASRILTAGHCNIEPTTSTEYFYVRERDHTNTSTSNQNERNFYDYNSGTTYRSAWVLKERANDLDGGGSYGLSDTMIIDQRLGGTALIGWMSQGTSESIVQTSAGTPMDNQDICVQGMRTRSCGDVEALTATKTVTGDGNWNREVRQLVQADYTAVGGDSGAPIYLENSPSVSVGVHQGNASNGNEVFSRIRNATPSGYYGADGDVGTTSRADAYLSNLYWRVLNRAPDSGGWTFWSGELSTCNVTTAAWAGENFLVAQEFLDDLPMDWVNRTVVDQRIMARVRMAYRTSLGREPDPSGFDFWTEELSDAVGKTAREYLGHHL